MKVVQISGAYVGAQEKIEYAIHKYLKKAGHESYILYAYGTSEDDNIIQYENRIFSIVRRGLWKYIGKTPHVAFFSTIQLIKRINEISPDIVHLHVLHHGYVDYILLLKFLAIKKISVVYTIHDMWIFTGGCYHYADKKCNGYMGNCINCPKKVEEMDCNPKKTSYYLKRKLDLYNKLKKVAFVSVSDWVHKEVMNSKLNCYSQYTVWNALDDAIYKDLESIKDVEIANIFNLNGKFIIFGVANNWNIKKGIYRFFELADLLGSGYEIILAGSVNKQIKELAPPNIIFLGKIDDKRKLAKCYKAANLHISMSLEETFGLTFIEAAFSNTRSIGFDSTAISQIIDKVKGFVMPKNDIYGVAEKVRELDLNRELCKLSDEEKKEIINIFSPEKMARGYLKVYSDLEKI